MEDPRRRFTETVDDYDRFRPDYPAAALTWITETLGMPIDPMAADLGSGTGISSRWLAAGGYTVTGVEPNEAMRARAVARARPHIRYVVGDAEATGLRDASVDLVVGCQAWHWFRLGPTLAECRRILRAGGGVVAVWNMRGDSPFCLAYDAVIAEHSRDVGGVPTGDDTIPLLLERPEVTGVVESVFPHGQRLDFAGLVGRAWSSSYVVHGVTDRGAFDVALRAVFDAHAADGAVWMSYRTRVLAFRVQ